MTRLLTWLCAALVATGGCVESRTETCAWGAVCPTGRLCHAPTERCVFPGQAEVCDASENGEGCSFPSAPEGEYYCRSGVCDPAECGDGIVGGVEQCDDGNLLDEDGCSANCLSDETCGNGYRDLLLAEGCDDGNLASHDGCSSRCTQEPPTWVTVQGLMKPRSGADGAYDPQRGQLVVFGGTGPNVELLSDTWEFDGLNWVERQTLGAPVGRQDHSVTHDPVRQRTVVFGGWTGSVPLADTWALDDGGWIALGSGSGPEARSAHAAAYDAARARLVVFGGERQDRSLIEDTWELDGDTWLARAPAASPAGRRYASMVYDPVRGRMVLFGGSLNTSGWTYLADTWEYDGTTWESIDSSVVPPARHGHRLVWDPVGGRVVLFGGLGQEGVMHDDTWEYAGGQWSEVTSPERPPARMQFVAAFEPHTGQVLVHGGMLIDYELLSDTWRLGSSGWSEVAVATPGDRAGAAVAYDALRGRAVLFGGATTDAYVDPVDETWVYADRRWAPLTLAVRPSRRHSHVMTYDSWRGLTVLFGGREGPEWGEPCFDETWLFDGQSWLVAQTDQAPPPRAKSALAFDSARGEAVLFGGGDAFHAQFRDTWEFDTLRWRAVQTDRQPSFRSGHAMAFDPTRGRVVLFGGHDGAQYLADTWEYDGTDWYDVSPPISPAGRVDHVLAYHPGRRRVMLLGGVTQHVYLSDLWEFDGYAWVPVTPAVLGPVRYLASTFYDPVHRELVVQGGIDAYQCLRGETLLLRYDDDLPDELCWGGVDEDGDGLVDCADPDCELRACGDGSTCRSGVCE